MSLDEVGFTARSVSSASPAFPSLLPYPLDLLILHLNMSRKWYALVEGAMYPLPAVRMLPHKVAQRPVKRRSACLPLTDDAL